VDEPPAPLASAAIPVSLQRRTFAILWVLAAGFIAIIGIETGSTPATLAIWTTFNALAYFLAYRYVFVGKLGYVDASLALVFVILLYTALPLVVFDFIGFSFSGLTDNRLFYIKADLELARGIVVIANCLLAGIGVGYLVARLPVQLPPPWVLPGSEGGMTITFIVSSLVIVAIGYFGRGADYADSYLFYRSLPWAVVVILNIMSALFIVSVFGVFAVKATERSNGFWIYVGLTMFVVFMASEARTLLVVAAFGAVIAADHFRRRLKLWQITSVLVLTLLIFSVLGLLRGSDQFAAIATRSEFMAVFVTGLDITSRLEGGDVGGDIMANVLTVDLQRLIPQPLLPFKKFEGSAWYVATYYPFVDEIGGGFAFGMVAESILTGGVASAIIRGFALGAVLGLVINKLAERPGLFRTITYMWILAFIYLSYRDTTFTLIGRYIYQLAPSLVLVWLLRWLLVRGLSAVRRTGGLSVDSGTVPG